MSRLVLVGLPGVGKTTLARTLADRWNVDALDTDEILATNVDTSAAQYLRSEGEAAFRARELEALREALQSDAVVATGGGVVCTDAAREVLSTAFTLWLDTSDDVILTRLGDVDRPLLGDRPVEALEKLRREREAWYRDVSRARVDTAASLDEVIDLVEREVERLST
jgi:shikimate kinase